MLRRGGRPGLIGLAARTAVVAGTANAVSSRQARRAQDRYTQAYSPPPQNYAPQNYAPPPAASAPTSDLTSELGRLADLRSKGLLTDDEFAAAKAKLLG